MKVFLPFQKSKTHIIDGKGIKWFGTPGILPLISFSLVIIFTQCREVAVLPPGDPDMGGLILPDGFDALVVADSIGRARHLAVNKNGED